MRTGKDHRMQATYRGYKIEIESNGGVFNVSVFHRGNWIFSEVGYVSRTIAREEAEYIIDEHILVGIVV